ncbi:uncharacterized protein LOC107303717 [Oryza brachyantha]|uniref:uncharacterized protein LOC107303717 n=1 Tax=Oryza brachyantha TaxID=4533 RepID=UPI001ADCE792|nr:uncharacterized protein LOC107303717 [Oryza brachyantha]
MESTLLPDDLLANVLGRLPPCSLAASRCVCKGWLAVVDDRRLLLPRRLDGFFFSGLLVQSEHNFFSPPSVARRVGGGNLDFLDTSDPSHDDLRILDHCNGLLLFNERVANPATRQWMDIPAPPPSPCCRTTGLGTSDCLVYDPMVSPHHFEVFSVPLIPDSVFHESKKLDPHGDDAKKFVEESSGWPLSSSSSCTTHVFSSRKWRWEERSFVRRQQTAGQPIADEETIADLDFWPNQFQRHAIYLKGAIYVHCKNNSLMRIALSNDTYQMIRSPARSKIADDDKGAFHLGKSEKGVYFALLWDDNNLPRFRVWLLNESSSPSCGGHMEWVLKTNISLEAVIDNSKITNDDSFRTPWIVNYVTDEARRRLQEDENLDWDYENGTILGSKNKKNRIWFDNIVFFLGFHPYKQIAFFWVHCSRAVSYHLNTSKVQELGALSHVVDITQSFPYTPCWIKLFENNS